MREGRDVVCLRGRCMKLRGSQSLDLPAVKAEPAAGGVCGRLRAGCDGLTLDQPSGRSTFVLSNLVLG